MYPCSAATPRQISAPVTPMSQNQTTQSVNTGLRSRYREASAARVSVPPAVFVGDLGSLRGRRCAMRDAVVRLARSSEEAALVFVHAHSPASHQCMRPGSEGSGCHALNCGLRGGESCERDETDGDVSPSASAVIDRSFTTKWFPDQVIRKRQRAERWAPLGAVDSRTEYSSRPPKHRPSPRPSSP